MADLAPTLTKEEFKNWLKGALALNFTKEALTDFVSAEVDRYHQRLLHFVPAANMLSTCNCTINSLPPCTRSRNHSHIVPGPKQLCSRGVCNILMDVICKDHRFRGPSWRNTDPRKWCTDAFEVAKCFFPPDGYSHTISLSETDFNGIMTVIINNLSFTTQIQDNLSRVPNICTKARMVGREIRHTPDHLLSDNDLRDYIDDLINLLCDPFCLLNDPSAQDAVRKLRMLKINNLTVHENDITEALRDNIKDTLSSEHRDLLQKINDHYSKLQTDSVAEIDRIVALRKMELEDLANRLTDDITRHAELKKQKIKQYAEMKEKKEFEEKLKDDALPEEILNMDKNALDIFKRALTHGKATDRSIRLMIVGHAGVGKTTLSEHILGHSQNTTIPIESTNGIDVHIKRCKVQLDTGSWLPVNEDSQHGNLCQRLASTLRAFRKEQNVTTSKKPQTIESGKPTKNVSESKEGFIQIGSGKIQFIYKRKPFTRSMSTGEKEFRDVIQEIKKRCTTVETNACDVSIWDFAGQYVFYCTHQVFLSRRAIYLMVTDLSKHIDSDVQDECNVDSDGVKTCKLSEFITFWLNSIYTYCGAGETRKPFVIIVGTFADKLTKDKRKEMASKFFTAIRENVVDTPMFGYLVDEDFDINNMIQDPRIDELKKKIVEVAMNQKWWHEELPVKWVSLERIIGKCKDAGEKVLHRDVLIALNQELTVPIDSDEELELFLGFYHDTGMIIYFSDDSLRDFILVDPQWLVDAFKTLITAEQFCSKQQKRLQMWRDFRKTAILRMDFIDCLWKSEGNEVFWKNKSTLLQFMEKLGIIARPVTENSVDGENIENEFFVPCMLKEAPPKNLIIHLHKKSEQCKITSTLCFASTTNLIPPHLFNKLIAACICRWKTATLEGKLALFCGFSQFEMEDHEHFLSLYFVNNGIQMWINRHSVSGKEEPDQQICAAAKIFIERKLHKETKERCPITVFWKCSQDGSNAVENMIPFDALLKKKNQRCSVHAGCHVITSRELRFWIHNQGSPGSTAISDNVVGYPLRKKVDDTMSERVVHMSRESMKSVGLLIYKGQGLGTVFRVGSRFLMTALHVVTTVVDLADSSNVSIDFNDSLLQPQTKQTKRYHLTNHKVFNETLDFAILEISDPDQKLPVALNLKKDMNTELSSISLIGYGHPLNQMEKTLDPDCKLISPNSLQIDEAEKQLAKDKNHYRAALKRLGKDPKLVENGYQGIKREGTLIVNCYMQQGASGSPAIAINGSECNVVGMLTHAIPEFYFHLPEALKNRFEKDFLFEIASAMPSIYQCVMSCNPQLAADIFR